MKYIFTIIILISLGYGLYYFSEPREKITTNPQVVIESNDSVIRYVSAHISELSPQKEYLGGTFYITNITADAGTGTVEYEDGHNAYSATFVYVFDQSGKVNIDDFQIIE